MKESLEYLELNDFDKRSFDIIYQNFILLYSYNDKTCKKCRIVQGKPNTKLGIKKYYCECVYIAVHKKMKKEKEKFMKDALRFIVPSVLIDEPELL